MFCFFDNNCLLLEHLLANDDTHFEGMALPVDVFHTITKHKDMEKFCTMHCNAADSGS